MAATGDYAKKYSTAQAKSMVLTYLAEGMTAEAAMKEVGRTRKAYENWRRDDPEFVAAVERLRVAMRTGESPREWMPFGEFSEKYFGARVFPHMQNVVDVLEGREPSWQPQGITWDKGEQDLVIVNMPPEHGKTTTLSMNYLAYRICMDPNIRIIVVSKTISMARKILGGIKNRLTHPRYAPLIAAYAPPGGFAKNSESWNQSMIYVSPDVRDSGEKDPTVEAIGIKGHIYGARADIILMDDCVDLGNAHDFDKQLDWIQAEVMSRISASGVLMMVGTRLGTRDLYGEARNPQYYPDDESPWSYLAMPAVLEFADDPKDWTTLWPKSNMPEVLKDARVEPDEDGLYPKWDGPRLHRKRARMTPGSWARVYMQQQTSEVDVFTVEMVKGCTNGQRLSGVIPRGMPGNRPGGMDGLIIIAGLDPATPAGYVGAVVAGLDPKTQKRYVLDVWNKTGMGPDDIRNLIFSWTERYGITEWRIEKNAFQTMLTMDREVLDFLRSRGAVLREHHTGAWNKWDADFGISAMAGLFSGWENERNLIELPGYQNNQMVRDLMEQLTTWAPDASRHVKTDIVMALWFCMIACQERVQNMTRYQGHNHMTSHFHTRYDAARQITAPVRELQRLGA